MMSSQGADGGHSSPRREKLERDLSDPAVLAGIGAEQVSYYRGRAPWYDDTYTCRGDYDQGAALNGRWLADLEAIASLVSRAPLRGDCVELGAGSGYWTDRVIDRVERLWALDAVPEMLEQAQRRLGARAAKARFEVVDLWRWTPEATWDCSLACFFIEHVPDEVLPGLLRTLHSALRPGATVFMAEGASFGAEPQVETREIGGRVFQVVERRRSKAELSDAFEAAGFTVDIVDVSSYICLTGTRR